MPRMKMRFTPNWSPTERLGMATASDCTSFTPPTPRSAAETAETEAATLESDSELRVAVTTMSARPSVGGGAVSSAIAGVATSVVPASSTSATRRAAESTRIERLRRTMVFPLIPRSFETAYIFYLLARRYRFR